MGLPARGGARPVSAPFVGPELGVGARQTGPLTFQGRAEGREGGEVKGARRVAVLWP